MEQAMGNFLVQLADQAVAEVLDMQPTNTLAAVAV
jgi:hypothetical protein